MNERNFREIKIVEGCGAHLLPKYIKQTSKCGKILTEYLLNSGGRPHATKVARKITI